ncbi:MAG: NADH-quinone oxidoreductase subunit K 1 [Chloroflexota bacterium]|jgi:NADH-quinone oxidoreductase subunit K|nr:MAG: NADH-quinone oxidoreductase subunit K [Chloroflexi bacterium UTCFX4]GIL16156.1 MAG: NADH-quinone oxidoreductase subunit K 1 [Chloroflexota bacterium]
MLTVTHFTVLSAILFSLGALAVLIRRNPLIMFMGIELMLNAVNLAFVAFSRFMENMDGQVFVFIVLTVAAAEVAVGLALVVAIFRARDNVDMDEIDLLKG